MHSNPPARALLCALRRQSPEQGTMSAPYSDWFAIARAQVGEDQRKKEDRMLSSEQEAQHAIIIESVKNKLQACFARRVRKRRIVPPYK